MELLRGYSNQTDVLARLTALLDLPDGKIRERRVFKQRQRHLSETDQQRVVEAYQACGSVYALAHQFGITRQTAAAILERHGIKRRYKVLSADDVAEASHLYEAGWSLARLGEHFDVNPSTILNALRPTDITIRPVGTNQWH